MVRKSGKEETKMDTEWMGRYRALIAALVLHSNVVHRGLAEKVDIGDGILLLPQEWQTLEYIIEHRDRNFSMSDASRSLGIPPSSFSRFVKTLCSRALVERYQMVGNRKNVILRPTDYALKLYERRDSDSIRAMFHEFFHDLDGISDEDLALFTGALDRFTRKLPSAVTLDGSELIKID